MASVKPKKHLGQHFLTDQNIATKIVNALMVEPECAVIEIGPGTGVLTEMLLKRFPNFLALDVDEESITFLKQKFPAHADQFRLQDFLTSDQGSDKVAVIGNFPYNISSQIFFKIWDGRSNVSQVVCMIQKEVADRICAKPGNKTYGILSVLLQAFFDIDYLFKVPPGVFRPPPKVQSAVIRLTRNGTVSLPCDEDRFRKIVKAAFGQRRKTLRNALKSLNLPGLEGNEELLSKRAEQLSVADFVSLTSNTTA